MKMTMTKGRHAGWLAAGLVLLALTGCETLPTGPSVLVLPAPGKPFDQFQMEDLRCREWSGQRAGSAQEVSDQNTAKGAVVGTVVGTGIGALLGAATGHAGTGAALGAGSGLLIGTASGADASHYSAREAQRRYDHAYLQCMYTYGNQIPGTPAQGRKRHRAPNYPPPDQPPPGR